ncbi:MAG: DUF4410 domain-containing protein [Verrucomicrobiota bacterium]
MKTKLHLNHATLFACLFALVVGVGSASADITNRVILVTGHLPRPNQIWVYNFAATPADLPADSALAGQPDLDTTPQTPDQIAEGKKLGAEIATELVADIQKLGMPAAVATADAKPQLNDLVIRGYLISVKEGDAKKRFGIGFGAGASELKTAVEGFQVTTNGLRKIGSGDVNADGSKKPGTALGVAGFLAAKNPAGLIISGGMHVYGEESGSSKVEGRAKQTAREIADALKQRFQEQCWIN